LLPNSTIIDVFILDFAVIHTYIDSVLVVMKFFPGKPIISFLWRKKEQATKITTQRSNHA
jgi:hypothetical protein